MILPVTYAVFAAAASCFDLRGGVVPNWLNAAAAIMAVAFAWLNGVDAVSFAAYAALWLAFSYLLYAAKVWGAGDGKFFAVSSLYFGQVAGYGLTLVLEWFCVSALFLAVFLAASRLRAFYRMLKAEWRRLSERAVLDAFSSASLLFIASTLTGFQVSPLAALCLVIALSAVSIPPVLAFLLSTASLVASMQAFLELSAALLAAAIVLQLFLAARKLAAKRKATAPFVPFLALGFASRVLL